MTARRKTAAALTAIFLPAALFLSGCAKHRAVPQGSPYKNSGSGNSRESANPVSASILLMDDVSSPSRFVTTQIIENKFNIHMKWELQPAEGYINKLNLLIASDELPDLIAPMPIDQAKEIGPKGALLPLNHYFSQMPHLDKLFAKDKLAYESSVASDGNIYAVPTFDKKVEFRYVPTIRTDLLAETGLSRPKTFDDFYHVLLSIKQKHPESLGIVNMEKTEALNDYGYNFNTRNGIFYDESRDKWVFGPLNAGYKEMIAYFHKLWVHHLLDPEFFTASQKQWEANILSGHAVFWLSWPEFSFKYEEIYRKLHPGSSFATAPISPMTTHYYPKKVVQGQYRTNTWTTLAISSKAKHVSRLIRLVDWMYSDQGSTALQYGIPGKTYSIVNGKKKFAASVKTNYNPNGKTVPGTLGLGDRSNLLLRIIRNDQYQEFPAAEQRTENALDAYRKNHYYLLNNDGMSLTFTEKELNEKTRLETDLNAYVTASAIQFITGEKPLSDYDSFTSELRSRGARKLEDIYNEAYGRFKENMMRLDSTSVIFADKMKGDNRS